MKPTLEQQINLLKLASGLAALPENYKHFSMGGFCKNECDWRSCVPREVTKKKINSCGTIACVLGHTPVLLGIKGLPLECWGAYSYRVLGLSPAADGWDYLFSADWVDHDNTAFGAVQRIVKFLENGCEVPKNGIPF